MRFSNFVNELYKEFSKELPGVEAHKEMAPLKRPTAEQIRKVRKDPRLSAIMVLFYPIDDRPHFVLTQRPNYKGTHSGQVSFPGGKMEEVDLNLKETALRETWEEVGVPKEDIQVLGELTEVYIPPSNFLVSPYVGFCDIKPEFIIDPIEVVEAFDVPASLLLDESIVKHKSIKISTVGMKINTPYYDINDKVVWGATAVMLAELKVILKRLSNG